MHLGQTALEAENMARQQAEADAIEHKYVFPTLNTLHLTIPR